MAIAEDARFSFVLVRGAPESTAYRSSDPSVATALGQSCLALMGLNVVQDEQECISLYCRLLMSRGCLIVLNKL